MAAYPWAKLWFKVLNDTRLRRAHRSDGNASALGIWTALILIAKRCNNNGVLEDGDGKIRCDDVADILGVPVSVVRQNLSRFARWHEDDDGWITVAEDGTITLPKFKRMQESESLERTRRYLTRQKERQDNRQVDGQIDGVFDAKKPRSLDATTVASEEEKPKGRESVSPALVLTADSGQPKKRKDDGWKRIKLVEKDGRFAFDGITEEDRSEWQSLSPDIDIDRELIKVLNREGTHPQWFAKCKKGGRWVATLKTWMMNAQSYVKQQPTLPGRTFADYRALDHAAEREWQRVLEAGQSNDFQKIGFAVHMLHERTIAALKAIDKDPANAVWKMVDIPIRDQLTYKAVFIPAWKASGIPYEIDGGNR